MIHKLILPALTFLSSIYASSQQILPKEIQSIDQYMTIEMTKWNIPGCAIVIVKGNDLMYAKGYGFRDVEHRLPVTPQTVFKIASCTKSFTAAAAGLLVQQKLLDWEQPIKKHLPDLKFITKELTDQITLRDLLSHRCGLYDDDWSWVGDHIDEHRLYEILSVMPQQKALRTGYMYSNMTYALAGQLISKQGKGSWRNHIRKFFFDPLQMSSSGFSHTESSGLNDFAYGYEYADSSQSFIKGNLNEHHTDSLSVCEAFGFISTSAADLSKWIRLFIQGGNWRGRQIIPSTVFPELIKPVNFIRTSTDQDVSESFYAMGWIQNFYKNHRLLQHSGGLWGFKSYMSFMPGDSLGIIVLTNGQPYLFPQAATYDLYDILLKLPPTSWSDKFLSNKKKASTEANNKEVNIPGTSPSKPFIDYAGVYRSKWIGDMMVTFEHDQLYFQFHTYPKEKMIHAHYNTFYTESPRTPGTGITFQFNHDGQISGMMLNEFLLDKIKM